VLLYATASGSMAESRAARHCVRPSTATTRILLQRECSGRGPWPSRSAIAIPALPRRRRPAYTYEVVALVENEQLIMRTAQGPFPMETTYEWSADGPTTTLMRLRNRGQPSGFTRIAAPALAAAVRRNTTKDLARLKRILEG
jgi:hypothetical protein